MAIKHTPENTKRCKIKGFARPVNSAGHYAQHKATRITYLSCIEDIDCQIIGSVVFASSPDHLPETFEIVFRVFDANDNEISSIVMKNVHLTSKNTEGIIDTEIVTVYGYKATSVVPEVVNTQTTDFSYTKEDMEWL